MPASLSVDLAVLLAEVEAAGFPEPEREFFFARDAGRMWRFDLCWPDPMVAFEREGLGPKGGAGRHQRAAGYSADVEKYNAAQLLGYLIVRGTPLTLRDGTAARDLIAALRLRSCDRKGQP